MNNDLISRSELKKALKSNCKPELCHDYNTAWCESCCRTNDFEDLIDNAPAVDYPFYQEAYQTGYEEGKNARPQGKCKTCKYYHPYFKQFSSEPRGDGYCVIARMTPEGMTTINCNDEFGCLDYQKGGAEMNSKPSFYNTSGLTDEEEADRDAYEEAMRLDDEEGRGQA